MFFNLSWSPNSFLEEKTVTFPKEKAISLFGVVMNQIFYVNLHNCNSQY